MGAWVARIGAVQDAVGFRVHGTCCKEEVLVMGREGRSYKGENKVVMMGWEKTYMEACVDALGIKATSDVLEIGFGCGYSADRIQAAAPRSHTIVECSVAVLTRLRLWARHKPNVVIIEGTWQAALPFLGKFDALFFDDFPLPTTALPLARAGVQWLSVRPHSVFPAPAVLLRPTARLSHPYAGTVPEFTDAMLAALDTRWMVLVSVLAQWHMKPHATLTGYLARPLTLSHPSCDTTITSFPVQPAPCCPYFSGNTLYVPRIQRRGQSVPHTPAPTPVLASTATPQAALQARVQRLRRIVEAKRKRRTDRVSNAAAAPGARKRKRTAMDGTSALFHASVIETLGLAHSS